MMGDITVTEFENIHFPTATKGENNGKLRLAAQGIGWKAFNTDEIFTIQVSDIKRVTWLRVARNYSMRVYLKNNQIIKFESFKRDDFDSLKDAVRQNFHLTLEPKDLSIKGWNWGKLDAQQTQLAFNVGNKTMFELPYDEVSNTNTVAKNEFNVEFTQHEVDASKKKSKEDSLVEIRFYAPGMAPKLGDDGAEVNEEEDVQTAAEFFYETIKSKADVGLERTDNIVSFKELPFLTPRGRYEVDMYSNFLRLRGKTYDYKILYSSINRLFLLPKPDDKHVLFVVGLDPPLRQGQTRYPFLVLQFLRDEETDVELNLDEATIQEKYDNKLSKSYDAPTFEVVSSVFRGLTQRKVTVPGSFQSRIGTQSVKCSMKANEGYLYPLEKSFLFIPKPTIYMAHAEIAAVTFSPHERYVTAKFSMKSGTDYVFSSISREELENLVSFIQSKKIKVKNEVNEESKIVYAESDGDSEVEVSSPKKRSRDSEDEDEESPDEDFVASDSGSDVEEEFNSDYASSSGSDAEGDSANKPSSSSSTPSTSKPKPKPKEKSSSSKTKEPAKKKTKKDPNAPKRAMSAFLYFSQDWRNRVKEELGGNASMGEVSKVLGQKWKDMASDDKEKYEGMARKDKDRYTKEMKDYGGKKSSGSSESKKEIASGGGSKKEFKSAEFVDDSDISDDSE